MVFLEHQKYSKQVPLLKQQINNLEQINNSWLRTDSIRQSQLLYYSNVIRDKDRSIEGLNKSLKNNKNIVKYGGFISVITVVLCLLLK